jgi:hypothetical protein
MALWAYIFLRFGFKNDNLYSHPPSQISPSPILPYPNPPSRLLWPVWLFKHKGYLPQRTAKERDKKYRGFYFLYRCGDFTLYFLSRSFAVCGILWKTTWLHNVDNIRQKDINIFNPKIVNCALRNMIRDVYPGSRIRIFSPIRNPGVKKDSSPGSVSAKQNKLASY